ncbi:MAG: hypothetical protein MPI93_08785, partial [Nitrosopumilus sp.]|nr:hypothetical protein [Nitrosopumilus sp.]
TCAQDGGTAVTLSSPTITRDGVTVSAIDTDTSGEYVVTHKCADANREGPALEQRLTVRAAGAGTNPVLANVPTEPILFKQGDAPPAHGATCMDGTLDRTGEIMASQEITTATTNGTYAVTLTCDDGDGSPATAIVTYYVDGTIPVIDPPTGAGSDQELGTAFSPGETATCKDAFPRGDRAVMTEGRAAIDTALAGNMEDTLALTHTCEDEVGNEAVQSVRTFQIRDTTAPAAPTASVTSRTIDLNEANPLDTPVCASDGGTAITLSSTITLDGSSAALVDTSVAGTYVVTSKCTDVRHDSADLTQTLTVQGAGSGTNPALSNVPTEPILFKQGDAPPAHGVTCLDGTLDRTGDIVPSQVIDSATTNGTYAVTLTCDDGDGSPATAIVTYYVDGTIPVIDPPTGAGSDQELGTAFSPGETATCKDAFPRGDRAVMTTGRAAIDTALAGNMEDTLALTHTCEDEVGNEAVQSVRTFQIRDTTAPAAPTASVTMQTIEHGAANPLDSPTCAQDGGTAVTLSSPTITLGGVTVTAIDTSVAGTYVVTSKCTDVRNDGPDLTQTLIVNPPAATGPALTGT